MTNQTNKKILIIDDDDEIRGAYVDIFKGKGWKVYEAKDGVEGLDIATSEEEIDVIFTGIIMPRMDGFEMIKALKERTTTANIPIFINSHMGREEDRMDAEKLGVKDFIVQGTTAPVEAVQKIIYQTSGKSYKLKVDPYELDAQSIINDMKFPEELKCNNCGSQLAIEVTPDKDSLKAQMICPNCGEKY